MREIVLLGATCFVLACGNSNMDQPISDLGSPPPTDSALLFAPGIVSTDAFEHSSPTFSRDGKIALWSIVEMPSYKARIVQIDYQGDRWSLPYRPAFCDTTCSEISPAFAPDGKTLYFSSGRSAPSGRNSRGNLLWRVERSERGWSEPQLLDSAVSTGGDYAASVAANGNLYFTHGPFRSPDWNIRMAGREHDAYLPASDVAAPVRSSAYEDGPFIAADESYLIFESDRPGGIANSIDLYIAFKLNDGSWSEAINLGPAVNTAAAERFARVSPKGKYLFFGSNRRLVNKKPNFDIYWIDASFIHQLRRQYVPSR